MQTSAQKARLCYLENGLYFWLSSCRHLLQPFQRPKHAPAAIVLTVNTYNNKYCFISPILLLVSGAATKSRGLRASAVKPPWNFHGEFFGVREHQLHRRGCRVMAWRRWGNILHEERKARNYWENEIPESWEYNFGCCVWKDLFEYLQVKMNE